MPKTKITLKTGATFSTSIEIEAIDNNLKFVGFIMVPDESGKRVIVTSDNLLLAEEL